MVRLTWTEENGAAARPARTPLVAPDAGPRCCHSARAGPGDKGTFSPNGHAPGLPDLPSRLSVLCAADDSAAVRLLAFGSFSLGRAAMPGADACRAQQPPAPCLMHVSACHSRLLPAGQLLTHACLRLGSLCKHALLCRLTMCVPPRTGRDDARPVQALHCICHKGHRYNMPPSAPCNSHPFVFTQPQQNGVGLQVRSAV